MRAETGCVVVTEIKKFQKKSLINRGQNLDFKNTSQVRQDSPKKKTVSRSGKVVRTSGKVKTESCLDGISSGCFALTNNKNKLTN